MMRGLSCGFWACPGAGGGRGTDLGRGTGDLLPYPPELGNPDVQLAGYAYPLAGVTVLKDGAEETKITANSLAEFLANITGLNQGGYTFGLWGEDPLGRKSRVYSTTFWVDKDSVTKVSDIIISPTIELAKTEVVPGEDIVILGYGAPGASIETWLNKESDQNVIMGNGIVGTTGEWNVLMPTKDLPIGQYLVKARENIANVGYSEFSETLRCGLGQGAEESPCQKSDINKDGKVNLIDFSILLFHWNTSDPTADINGDGKVNLIDFSIMLFCWTG